MAWNNNRRQGVMTFNVRGFFCTHATAASFIALGVGNGSDEVDVSTVLANNNEAGTVFGLTGGKVRIVGVASTPVQYPHMVVCMDTSAAADLQAASFSHSGWHATVCEVSPSITWASAAASVAKPIVTVGPASPWMPLDWRIEEYQTRIGVASRLEAPYTTDTASYFADFMPVHAVGRHYASWQVMVGYVVE